MDSPDWIRGHETARRIRTLQEVHGFSMRYMANKIRIPPKKLAAILDDPGEMRVGETMVLLDSLGLPWFDLLPWGERR